MGITSDCLPDSQQTPHPIKMQEQPPATNETDVLKQHTIVIDNTTDEAHDINLFGYNKFAYLGYKSWFGTPKGVEIYPAEMGTTAFDYARFLWHIARKPKYISGFGYTATSAIVKNISSQVHAKTIYLEWNSADGTYSKYPILPFRYIKDSTFSETHHVDIPIPFRLDADTWLSLNVLPKTKVTITLNELMTDDGADRYYKNIRK